MATATRARTRSSVSGLAVWRLGDHAADPGGSDLVEHAVHAVRPHVTGCAVVAWPLGRPAPRVTSTEPDDVLDPACWHLLFGGMLLAPLLDVRSGAPFREPPARRLEVSVFVNRVRDLVVPGSCALATLGPAAQVFAAADAIHDALGPQVAVTGTSIALAEREAAVVAEVFLDPAASLSAR